MGDRCLLVKGFFDPSFIFVWHQSKVYVLTQVHHRDDLSWPVVDDLSPCCDGSSCWGSLPHREEDDEQHEPSSGERLGTTSCRGSAISIRQLEVTAA
jgi:hypothetical protein